MPIPCSIVVDEAATITAVDEAFCALMRMPPRALIGLFVIAITAPEDRQPCYEGFAALRAAGAPFTVTKRLIRGDGTHVWVRKLVREIAREGDGRRFVMEVEEIAGPLVRADPGKLLAMARVILQSRRRRTATFGAELFPDIAWDMLLSIYIAEAEGRLIDLAGLHAAGGAPLSVMSRWVRALAEAGLVDHEAAGRDRLVVTSLRLTATGHERFESYLSSLFVMPQPTRDLLNGASPAVPGHAGRD